ncbi:MAG: enoyl-CoA hydratase/isomerase family protein, partial [Gammaproteobacteria bacterium]
MNGLSVERRGHALVLTIDREEAGNSISAEVSEGIENAIAQVGEAGPGRANGRLCAVVITGTGTRFFSAGGDIKRYRALETRQQLAATFE